MKIEITLDLWGKDEEEVRVTLSQQATSEFQKP